MTARLESTAHTSTRDMPMASPLGRGSIQEECLVYQKFNIHEMSIDIIQLLASSEPLTCRVGLMLEFELF